MQNWRCLFLLYHVILVFQLSVNMHLNGLLVRDLLYDFCLAIVTDKHTTGNLRCYI